MLPDPLLRTFIVTALLNVDTKLFGSNEDVPDDSIPVTVVVDPTDTVLLFTVSTKPLNFEVAIVVFGRLTPTRFAVSLVLIKDNVTSSILEFSPIVNRVAVTDVVSRIVVVCVLDPLNEQVFGIVIPADRVYVPGATQIVTAVSEFAFM